MGQKSPEEVPPASVEPASDASSTAPSATPDADSELPAAHPSTGKGLWALMHHAEEIEGAESPAVSDEGRSAIDAPVNPKDKRLRQLPEMHGDAEVDEDPVDQVPTKRVDKRLRQVEELEVEIEDEDAEVDLPRPKIDRRLRQMEQPEVEIVDEAPDEFEEEDGERSLRSADQESRPRSKVRGIPSPFTSQPTETLPAEVLAAIPVATQPRFSFARAGRSKSALWSCILGVLSLPISLIAIYPAIWTRIPASISGIAAMLLGFLSLSELARAGHKGRELILAYVGIAAGLLAMFSAPLIYAPLDLYGQWTNSYSGGHLQQIALATDAYLQQHHRYPAGGLFKEIPESRDLEPLHGWMTLLLPHLPEGASLAGQIDLNKPYFDPANLPVMSQAVPSFLAAGGSMELIQGKFGPAHFAGVGGLVSLPDGSVAHAGIFDVNSETTRDDVLDGLSNTMIAGEVSISYPAWGEPHNWRQIGKGLNHDPQGFGNSRHTGAMFLMADGSVRFLPNKTDPKVLEALSTRDGEDKP